MPTAIASVSDLNGQIAKAGSKLVIIDFHAQWVCPYSSITSSQVNTLILSAIVWPMQSTLLQPDNRSRSDTEYKVIGPVYERFEKQYPSAVFLKCDVDQARDVASKASLLLGAAKAHKTDCVTMIQYSVSA